MTNPADYAERIMASIDAIEAQHGFRPTLKILCCIVGWYVRMNCEPQDFDEAAEDVRKVVLEAMIKDEEILSQVGDVH
jgi:hypothetical protein